MTSILNGEKPGMNTSQVSSFQDDLNLVFPADGAGIEDAVCVTSQAVDVQGVQGVETNNLHVQEDSTRGTACGYNSQHTLQIREEEDVQDSLVDSKNNNFIEEIQLKSQSIVDSQEQQVIGKISVIQSHSPATLGKKFWFDREVKKMTSAQVTKATVQIRDFSNVDEFITILQDITVSQAICASLPSNGKASNTLVTKAAAATVPGAITRTKEDFAFKAGSGGILTLDYDPHDPANALSREALMEALLCICPELSSVGVVWWCSSSSHIFVGDQPYQKLQGQRFFILVRDAGDIERAGKVLSARLWLAGHGRILVSASGQRLVRDLFDKAMFERARLDFMGGAICEPPVRQERGQPMNLGGQGWLNTVSALPALSKAQEIEFNDLVQQKREAMKEEAVKAQQKWIAERMQAYSKALQSSGVHGASAEHLATLALGGVFEHRLPEYFQIPLPGGKFVSVKEVLMNPTTYNKVETLDPLEPDYRDSSTVGIIFATAQGARLHSLAHGGATYELCRGKVQLVIKTGEMAELVEAMAMHLSRWGDMYCKSGVLVQISHSMLITHTEYSLKMLLAQRFGVKRMDKKEGLVGVDIPADVPKMLLASMAMLPFRPLLARISLPCFTPTGREITTPGYDEETLLYLDLPANYVTPVSANADNKVTDAEVVKALATLWHPWALYRYEDEVSRGAMVSAILTALNRQTLDLAPGCAMDASTTRCGKTRLAQSLSTLITGVADTRQISLPGRRNADDEIGKLILSKSLGGSPVFSIDNISGFLKSDKLAELVTSSAVSGRLMHQNVEHFALQRFFVTLTGKNLQLDTDLLDRLLSIRIQRVSNHPNGTSFPFSPVDEVLRHRNKIAAAGQTILRAFVQAGMPNLSVVAGRFEHWGRLIRNCVLWIEKMGFASAAGIGKLGDPEAAFRTDLAVASDPESAVLDQLLVALHRQFGDAHFKASDVDQICQDRMSSDSTHQAIRGCIVELATPGKEMNPISIGLLLQRLRERPANGFQLVTHAKKTRTGVTMYAVEDLLDEEDPALAPLEA